MTDRESQQSSESTLPQQVVAKLREVSTHEISVAKSVDEAILADARNVLSAGKPSRRRFAGRKWAVSLVSVGGLAAALLVAVWPQWNGQEAPRMADASSVAETMADDSAAGDSSPSVLAFQKEDVDQNGQVDILDAFALARHVRDSSSDIRRDQNGDGIVNDDDIRLVAQTAVML